MKKYDVIVLETPASITKFKNDFTIMLPLFIILFIMKEKINHINKLNCDCVAALTS